MAVAKNAGLVSAIGAASASQRILIYGINYAPEPIGVGRYTADVGSYLAAQGAEVEVVTAVPHYPGWVVPNGYRNRYSVELFANGRITRCPLLLKAEMRGVWRLIAPLTFALTSAPVAVWRILATRPGTVLCIEPTLFCAPLALLAAKLVGAKTVLHVQDLEIDAAFGVGHLQSTFLQWLANKFEHGLLRSFDAVVTISHRMQDRLASKGVAPARLKIVRNWINLEQLKPLKGTSSYRRDLALPEGRFVALYAGNIGAKQALPVILDAAERLTAESNIVFVIAGDGPEKKRLMARYGHLANVRFLPVQPEARLCELLNLADIHLLPQLAGAADLVLPSKLGGMLASGKPSIVMADPGTELYEFLGDGAIMLPAGDSSLLAETIKCFYRNPDAVVTGNNDSRIAQFDAKKNLPEFRAILTSTK